MSKISLEQQIAELTPEQKNNMGRIYKNYLLSLISIIVLGVVLLIGIFFFASIKEKQAKDEYDKIQTMIAINEANNIYDFSLFDVSSEALNEYYDMKQLKPLAFVIGSGVAFLGALIVFVVFKNRYPYFSEKKYTYLKKMERHSGDC